MLSLKICRISAFQTMRKMRFFSGWAGNKCCSYSGHRTHPTVPETSQYEATTSQFKSLMGFSSAQWLKFVPGDQIAGDVPSE